MSIINTEIESTERLLNEARDLINRSRVAIAIPNTTTTTTTKRRSTQEMSTSELTPQRAGELYATGQTVYQVAVSNGITYGKARQLIMSSGTPIRDASARLKGRTRKKSESI